MLQPFPKASDWKIDPQAESELDWMRAVVGFVRTMRSERGLPPGSQVNLLPQGLANASQRPRE